MEDYEIAVFEYSDLYENEFIVSKDKILDAFMKKYERYFPLEYYDKKDIWFTKSRLWMSYTDKSGGDKPMTLFLFGLIAEDLVAAIKDKVEIYYKRFCGDCGKEIQVDKWALCEVCRNT